MPNKPTLVSLPLLLAGAMLLQPMVSVAACAVTSGPKTAALVELYTSEGCSSCPPADAQLSRLKQALDPGAEFVPLSLHVNYWDYIGWKDPYAQEYFAVRQRWLVQANEHTAVFTPHFFVGGIESREWPGGLRAQVRRQNAQMAQAQVQLQGHALKPGLMSLKVDAQLLPDHPKSALYLALTESKLASKVSRGENAGATLAHDHVVRAWLGPVVIRGTAGVVQQDVPLDPAWSATALTVVAFVQDQDTGRVLQAVSTLGCAQP
jgi:hypothetical protein